MVTGKQIRAARILLGWTQAMLADRALVALTTLKELEADKDKARSSTQAAVRKTLEEAGITFLSVAQGSGVLLKNPDPPSNRKGSSKNRPR